MAAPKVINVEGWVFEDVFDTHPVPGAYVSPDPPKPMTVNVGPRTVTVNALNYNHALARALHTLAAETGGDLKRCELCGAHLRYAALFFDAADTLHVVGKECADRVESGLSGREEWVLASALKEAKAVTTRYGERWRVDLHEPDGWRMVPFSDRPTFVSMWTPKGSGRFRSAGKPRLTVWAANEAELHDKVREFRAFLRDRSVNMATVVKPRRY